MTVEDGRRRLPFIMEEIAFERQRQLDRWDEQSLDNGTKENMHSYKECAAMARDLNDRAGGGHDWATVLLEEVYEVLSEAQDKFIREELVQVAAVCAAWINDIDKRAESESVTE